MENQTYLNLWFDGIRRDDTAYTTQQQDFKGLKRLYHSIAPGGQFVNLSMSASHSLKKADLGFSKLLLQIPDPPEVLYYRGNTELFNDPFCVAVVGTRKASAYGISVTDKICTEIAERGIVIISGLARGIDAAAHKAALKAGGKTIAVLGDSLDKIYPPEHKSLAEEIVRKNGLVISEYPDGSQTYKSNFVARNRIIAGLSKASIIIEAPFGSGALITADFALDYNREVFAVPGPINAPNSAGPNNLIKQGARPLLSAADILEIFNMLPLPPQTKALDLSAEQIKIINALSENSLNLSEIIEKTNLDAATVSKNLTMLELADRIYFHTDGKAAVK